MIKVSVIVPVYNSEKYIGQCLDSFINQEFTDFEVIVIDDGSLDKTPDVVKEYTQKDHRIRLIKQENKGVSVARNKGIAEAKGEYLTFCDSDDFVAPIHLKTIVELIESSPSYQMAIIGDYNVSEISEIRGENVGKGGVYDSKELIKESIDKTGNFRVLAAVWNKIFITRIIKENKLAFNPILDYGEDWLFVLDYLRYIHSVVISENLTYYYRIYEGNRLSTKYRSDGFENAILVRKLISEWFPEDYGGDKLASSIINIFNIYQASSARKLGIKGFITELRKYFCNKDLKDSYLVKNDKQRLIRYSIINNRWNLYCSISFITCGINLAKYYCDRIFQSLKFKNKKYIGSIP